MKKKVLISALALFLLIFAVFVYSKVKGGRVVNKDTSMEQNGLFAKNVVTSIKDAINQKLTLTCEFTDQTGATTKSYIKNGAVRVSSVGSNDQTSEIVIKDKKMYMWDDKKKEGFVYTIPDETENSQAKSTGQDVVSVDSYLNMIDKYKDSCKVSTVDDSLFAIPTNVKFQDMSKLLEELQKQMPQVQTPSE